MAVRYHSHLKKVERIAHHHNGRHESLRLDGNELAPHLPSEYVREILANVNEHHFSAYPELLNCYDALSRHTTIDSKNLLLTNGSEDGIRQIFTILYSFDPSDSVLVVSPNYGMYYVYGKMFNANIDEVSCEYDFEISKDKIINAINHSTKLLVIANPNGTTGALISDEDIDDIVTAASKHSCAVLLDEAYQEFRGESPWPKKATEKDNLFVLRTLSKAGGLAGLRYGYIITNEELLKILWNSKPIYELNSVSALAGNYLMKDKSKLQELVQSINRNKVTLANDLRDLNLSVYSGYANFILLRLASKCSDFQKFMRESDILIKTHGESGVLKEYVRITVPYDESLLKLSCLIREYFHEEKATCR